IVTETTLMAMPEISIGLFPDAGADWFLQRFPFQSGVFLGLTGSRFNGSDAMLGNLAEYALPAESREATLAALCLASWQGAPHEVIAETLLSLTPQALPASQILAHQAEISQVVTQASFQEALQQVALLAQRSPWLQAAADYVAQGCASSAGLHWLLMRRCRRLSLDAVLNLELTVASHCVTRADFAEGVRALLIDKDKQPKWQKSTAEIDDAWLQSFLQPLSLRS
ncbi:MAG: enoyl-CoA hydratase/isomerase family protein, partial [Vitreoscilla sp.]|nr:enoyl-CoA hydratase/isomerase family protein [Vitreoscilla sp.]